MIKIDSNSSPNKLLLSVEEMKAIVEEAHLHGIKVTAHATNDLAIKRAIEAGVDAIEHAYVVSDETLQLMERKKSLWYLPIWISCLVKNSLINYG